MTRMPHKSLFTVLTAAAVISAWVTQPIQAGAPEGWDAGKLTSEKMCNVCHAKEDSDQAYPMWQKGPHAKAFATLGTPKAKEVGAKQGIDDPQTSGKCLSCHSTAYGFTEEKVTDVVPPEDGVTCQTCHGPGKAYKTKHKTEVETSKEKYGLSTPTSGELCMTCHGEENPTHNPEKYTKADGTKVGFDFEQAVQKIKHAKERAK